MSRSWDLANLLKNNGENPYLLADSLKVKPPELYLFGPIFGPSRAFHALRRRIKIGKRREATGRRKCPAPRARKLTKANQGFLFELFRSGDKTAPEETKGSRSVPPKIALTDLELIRANPAEPRKTSNETGLRELADSIQKYGLLNPILVRPEPDGTFTTLAGSRRLKACQLLGHKTIPALVVDDDPLQVSLIENLVREELNPVDEGEALVELKERGSFTLQELSLIAGRSESYTSEILSLASLPETIKASVRTSEVQPTKNFLIELAREKHPKKLMKLWQSFQSRNTSTVKSLREKRGKSGSTLSYKGQGYVMTIRFKVKGIDRAKLIRALEEGQRNLLERFQPAE